LNSDKIIKMSWNFHKRIIWKISINFTENIDNVS